MISEPLMRLACGLAFIASATGVAAIALGAFSYLAQMVGR